MSGLNSEMVSAETNQTARISGNLHVKHCLQALPAKVGKVLPRLEMPSMSMLPAFLVKRRAVRELSVAETIDANRSVTIGTEEKIHQSLAASAPRKQCSSAHCSCAFQVFQRKNCSAHISASTCAISMGMLSSVTKMTKKSTPMPSRVCRNPESISNFSVSKSVVRMVQTASIRNCALVDRTS